MRAIGVTTYGGPEALHQVEVDPEVVGPGQVRVGVTAFAVNPTDTMVRDGSRADTDSAPSVDVPGMDVVGRVLELGQDVTGFQLGERVVAVVVPSGEHGAYREEVVLPAGSVVPAPAEASDAEAATLPMNALTARLALDQLGLVTGQTLAVTGAAGAMGGYAVQLGHAAGLRVVADASEDDEELVRTLGADVVVRRGEGFADAVRAEVPDGVDGLVDAAIQLEQVTPAVRDGGAVATLRGWDGAGDTRLRYEPVMVALGAERTELLDRLAREAESGVLTLRVADVLPADQAAEAHRRLEAGGVRGRLVLTWE